MPGEVRVGLEAHREQDEERKIHPPVDEETVVGRPKEDRSQVHAQDRSLLLDTHLPACEKTRSLPIQVQPLRRPHA